MADRIAKIAAWADVARPGWRTEDIATLHSWAHTPSITRRPERISLRAFAEWAMDVQLISALIAFIRDTTKPQASRDKAQAILELLKRPGDLTIRTDVADGLVNTMQNVGLIDATQAAEAKLIEQETVTPAQDGGFGEILPSEFWRAKSGG